MAKLAKPALFEGAPVFHIPQTIGFTVNKPMIYRIPVTGKRPIKVEVSGLPEGLFLDGLVVSGTTDICGEYSIKVSAENDEGKTEAEVTMVIGEDIRQISPLLGFTSWNAFREYVSQEKMEETGRLLVETGLADVGYAYVNIDSGWQHGERDADGTVKPNPKFPDMKGFCDRMHKLGLKCGIYETPMKTAWGCPPEYESIPGCTDGEPDPCFPGSNGGIGKIHLEKENAEKWADWGFDYLKYDWSLSDTVNAELMRKALRETNRDFAMSVTVFAPKDNIYYWKKYINSYRCNHDSEDNFEKVKSIFESAEGWEKGVAPGHFFDMDMLETGECIGNGGVCKLSENEQVFALTMRLIFSSPIQISCDLSKLSQLDLALYANFEALEIHQDVTEAPHREKVENGLVIISRRLADGSLALAVFNPDEEEKEYTPTFSECCTVRDVWANEEIEHKATYTLPPHACLFYRIKE